MHTEYHCHVLPGIDDGAKDTETSLAMIQKMQEQGIERIVATPHFYAHRERSLRRFLEKRQEAFEKINGKTAVKEIHLGAEIAIEHGISEIEGINKLAMGGTKLILLELPYDTFHSWLLEEAYNIGAEYHLRVVFAHIHRYLEYYTKNELQRVLSMNAIFQINNEAFETHATRSFVRGLVKDGKTLIFGSDAHDLGERKPNWDLCYKKAKPEWIEESDGMYEEYRI